MNKFERILDKMKRNPAGVSFPDLCILCTHFFGEPRQKGASPRIYKTPWPGNPRVNIQNDHGLAKKYQVKQVLLAIERLSELESGHR